MPAVVMTAALLIGGVVAGMALRAESKVGSADEAGGVKVIEPPDSRLREIASLEDELVNAMLWRGDEELWYVGAREGDQLWLTRLNPDSGAIRSYDLGASAVTGPHTYIVEDGTGTLWIASDYTVVAFSTREDEVIAHYTIERDDPLAGPGAADPADPLPGTWVNGASVDGAGRAVITRNHVRGIFELTPKGIVLRETLPVPAAGLLRDGGEPFAADRAGNVMRSTGGGALTQLEAGAMFDGSEECSLLLSPAAGTATVTAAFGSRTADVPAHPGDRLSVSAGGRVYGLAFNAVGQVARVRCSDGSIETYSLGLIEVTGVSALRGGHLLEGKTIRVVPQVDAIATSLGGRIAFRDSSGGLFLID